MKSTFAAAAIVLATTTAANSASTPTVWQGDAFITTNTNTASACSSAGITTGDLVQAIYAPKNSQNNSTDQLAVFFGRGSAHQLVPASGTTLNGATSVNITNIDHNGGAEIKKNQALGPIQISSVTGTQLLTISVPVPDIDGCKLTFNGVLYPRPGNLSN